MTQEAQPFAAEFQQALALLNDGHIDQAREIYHSILTQDGANSAAHVNLAAIALQENDFESTINHCSQVPDSAAEFAIAIEVLAEANLRLAESCTNTDFLPQVAQAAEDAVALMGGDSEVRRRAAVVLDRFAGMAEDAGKMADAANYTERSVALNSGGAAIQ